MSVTPSRGLASIHYCIPELLPITGVFQANAGLLILYDNLSIRELQPDYHLWRE